MSEKEAATEPKKEIDAATKSKTLLGMNRELIPCKLLFFVMDMGFSCIFSFMSLFYIESGMTVDKLGLSNSIGDIVSLPIYPLWGMLMDSLKRHRIVLVTVIVVATTGIEFSKAWVVILVSKYDHVTTCFNVTVNNTHSYNAPFLPKENHLSLRYNQRLNQIVQPLNSVHNHLAFNPDPFLFGNASMFNTSSNTTHEDVVCHIKKNLSNPDTLFYAVALNCLVSSFLFAGMMSYVETAIIKTVMTRDPPSSYGEQKVFSPIGSAFGSLMAGIAVDHFRPKNLSKYLIAFFMYVPLSLLMLPLLYIITKQADWGYGTRKKGEKKVSPWRHMYNVFKSLDNIIFFTSTFISGTSLYVWWSYMFIYVDSRMHPTKTMLALTNVVSMTSELIVYPLSAKLIKVIGGRMNCVVLGLAANALRMLLLCQCTEAWHVLLIQPLHGLGMSLAWTAMIEHVWAIFPKEITTTALGILTTFTWVAPGIVTKVIGGFLYRKYDGPTLFRGMAYIAGSWSAIVFFYITCCKPSEEKEVEKNDTGDKEDHRHEELGVCKDVELEEVVNTEMIDDKEEKKENIVEKEDTYEKEQGVYKDIELEEVVYAEKIDPKEEKNKDIAQKGGVHGEEQDAHKDDELEETVNAEKIDVNIA